MHAAIHDRLVGGFKPAGIRLGFLSHSLGRVALRRQGLPHELCGGAVLVFGFKKPAEGFPKFLLPLLALCDHIPFNCLHELVAYNRVLLHLHPFEEIVSASW